MPGIEKKENDQKQNQLKWHLYLVSALFILVGILFMVYKEIDSSVVCKVFAVVFAVAGIISILSYCFKDVTTGYYRLDLVYGTMAVFAALLFYTRRDELGDVIPVIIGIILLGNGVIKLQHSIDMKRIDRKLKQVTEMWLVVMIFALAGIVAGLITVYLTPENPRTLFIIVGIAFVVAGGSDIFTHIVFNRKVKMLRGREEEEPAPASGSPLPLVEETVPETEEVTLKEDEAVTDSDQDADGVLFEVETPVSEKDPVSENTDDTDQQA